MPYKPAADVSIDGDQIAIAITHGTFGSHLGVAIRDEDGSAKLLHLAWHRMLRQDNYPQPNWAASIANVPAAGMELVTPVIRSMLGNFKDIQGKVCYGVNLYAGQGAIRADGSYLAGSESDGHTCSSFVAEIFNGAGLPLIDLHSWDPTDENKAWGEAVACCLDQWGKHANIQDMPEHVAAVRANNKGLRVLPEEVAAAAIEPQAGKKPAQQKDLQTPAARVLKEMQSVCEAGPQSPLFSGCVKAYQSALLKIKNAVDEKPQTAAAKDQPK